MKIENKIKKKFIYNNKRNFIKWLYFSFHKYFKKYSYKSYSFGGVDLLIQRFFRYKNKGVYIDIGCYHPLKGSNTYLLFKKGWSGINVDLDSHAINLFNIFRPNDHNLRADVSSKHGTADLFTHHEHSAVQTIDPENAKKNYKGISKNNIVETSTLNFIIQNSKFKNHKIDFLTIDIEGHEFEVLKEFDFKKYKSSIVVIEYNDPN